MAALAGLGLWALASLSALAFSAGVRMPPRGGSHSQRYGGQADGACLSRTAQDVPETSRGLAEGLATDRRAVAL